MVKPKFLIVGAAKSGTTSLHVYLREHPHIFVPEVKETWFFSLKDNANKAILDYYPSLPQNFLDYLKLFEAASFGQICGEVTPSYLYYYNQTIANIKKFLPDWQNLKIIIILREPIDKVLSHYNFVREEKLDPEELSLREAIRREDERYQNPKLLLDVNYIRNTKYYEAVSAYIETFNQVKIFLYEDLRDNPTQLLTELYSFIGVVDFIPPSLGIAYNKSKKTLTNNTLEHEVLSTLKKAFRKDLLQLQKIIAPKDISHWLVKYT